MKRLSLLRQLAGSALAVTVLVTPVAATSATAAPVAAAPIATQLAASAPVSTPVRAATAATTSAKTITAATKTTTKATTKATKAASAQLTSKAVGQSATYKQVKKKLKKLAVKGRAPKTGYDRSKFGSAWSDQDRNGCDTRNDILRRDLTSKKYKAKSKGCVVATGKLKDKFTGKTITFNRSKNASAVQIDHIVALSDAWQKGAQKLTKAQRTNLANDPLNLRAVDGKANQQKSDSDAASWLPKNKSFRCQYVATQIDVKAKYGLWVTKAEKAAMQKVLKGCSGKIPQIGKVPAPKKDAPVAGSDSKSGSSSSNSGSSSGPVKPTSNGECPASAPIKGNQGSNGWKYHIPGGRWYSITKAEQCFATQSAAEKAGYEYAKNQ